MRDVKDILYKLLSILVGIVAWGIVSLIWLVLYALPLILATTISIKFLMLYVVSAVITFAIYKWGVNNAS